MRTRQQLFTQFVRPNSLSFFFLCFKIENAQLSAQRLEPLASLLLQVDYLNIQNIKKNKTKKNNNKSTRTHKCPENIEQNKKKTRASGFEKQKTNKQTIPSI